MRGIYEVMEEMVGWMGAGGGGCEPNLKIKTVGMVVLHQTGVLLLLHCSQRVPAHILYTEYSNFKLFISIG